MQSSISPPNGASALLSIALVAVLSPWLGESTAISAEWEASSWIDISAGDESDLALQPDSTAQVVSGGRYLDFSPGLVVTRPWGARSLVRLSTQASWERFLRGENRRLYAQYARGDVLLPVAGLWRGRLSAGGDFFLDSERETSRRLGGGGEISLERDAGRWSLELTSGVGKNRYPRFETVDDGGVWGTYGETSWSLGAVAVFLLPRRTLLLSAGGYRGVDARDPLYDARSRYLQFHAQSVIGAGWKLRASLSQEQRTYVERQAGVDSDEYIEGRIYLEYSLSARLDLVGRHRYARYTWPTGVARTTHRSELALRIKLGNERAFAVGAPGIRPGKPDGIREHADPLAHTLGVPRRNGDMVFRIHAPDAASVMVAGDFNDWDRQADPLRRQGDGWWELVREIPPGTYMYVYLVDGVTVTPPEAHIIVEDGFGRANGLLVVSGSYP